jgi:glycogen synthase
VPALYRAADVFVSPTYAEGFSNSILEAMASGLPTLSCYAVGVVDCLRDDENGLLVRPGDVPAQAAALRRLIEDAALRRRLAATALEECRCTCSWEAVGAQIMGVYAALHGKAPDTRFDPVLPRDPGCRFRAEPHLL